MVLRWKACRKWWHNSNAFGCLLKSFKNFFYIPFWFLSRRSSLPFHFLFFFLPLIDPPVVIPLTWPQGTYGLPMTTHGCHGIMGIVIMKTRSVTAGPIPTTWREKKVFGQINRPFVSKPRIKAQNMTLLGHQDNIVSSRKETVPKVCFRKDNNNESNNVYNTWPFL